MSVDRINDTSQLENATAYIIHRTDRLLQVHLQKMLRRMNLDVTPAQWFILFRVWKNPGLTQGDLADADLGDYPNITRQVDGLLRKGLVKRERDPNDRRRSLIFLSDAGQLGMEHAATQLAQIREETYAGIDSAEIEQMIATLKKLQNNIT